jgi:hypothetical protein
MSFILAKAVVGKPTAKPTVCSFRAIALPARNVHPIGLSIERNLASIKLMANHVILT